MHLILALALLAGGSAAAEERITTARFALVVDGVEFMVFQELQGISSSVVAGEGGGSANERKLDVDAIVRLSRPFTSSLELAKWHEQAVASGPAVRKHMALVVYGANGKVVARYHLENAWPAKIEIGALKAGASEVLMETVTMVCEHIQRVAP